jgi:hypothetical protein
MRSRGASGSQCHYGLDPVYFNPGLMKPPRGLTPAAGEEKLGQGKIITKVDNALVKGINLASPPC